MTAGLTAALLGGLVALVLRLLLRRRRGRRAARTPLGGLPGEFATPYRVPGRRRSGRGF